MTMETTMATQTLYMKVPETVTAAHVAANWKVLETQRKAGEFCDVVIACNGSDYLAHRCVLATVSKYFRTLFMSPLSSGELPFRVSLDHFPPGIVSHFLDVVYTQADICRQDIAEMLRLADFLQYDWLLGVLFDHVRNLLEDGNVIDWWEFSKEWNITELLSLTQHYVCDNFERLQRSCIRKDVDFLLIRDAVHIDPRDSVLVMCDVNESNVYALDLVKSHVKEISHPGISALWNNPMYKIKTVFTFNKVFYTVTESTSSTEGEGETLTLWKYQHCSWSFDCMQTWHTITFSRLLDGVKINLEAVAHPYWHGSTLYFHFYAVFDQMWIFEVDFLSGEISLGYIYIHDSILQIGSRYIVPDSLDYVYDIKDFDFSDESVHSTASVTLSSGLHGNTSFKTVSELSSSATTLVAAELDQIFCVANPVFSQSQQTVNIFRLDIQNRVWVCMGSLPNDLTTDFVVYESHSGLYFHVKHSAGGPKQLVFFDKKTEELKKLNIDVTNLMSSTMLTVPTHVLSQHCCCRNS